MYLIGLLGGVASGKSLVASILAEHGAAVLDADRAVHELLDDPDVQRQLAGRLGGEILKSDGTLDRRAVAELIFGQGSEASQQRHFVQQLLHPLARRKLREQMQRLHEAGTQVFVIDAPLLLEAGWGEECDLLLMVDAPLEDRLARAAARGWTAEETRRREAVQLPIEIKRRQADVILENSAGVEELRRKTAAFWQQHVEPQLAGKEKS